jgi:hypothetical protein
MPAFSNELPHGKQHLGFTLRRTPTDRPLLAVVTSADYVVCDTHYWGGRTTPHEDEDCKACTALQPRRTHVYLSAIDVKTREHFLFECTAHAAISFEEYRARNNTLRGCYFCASRPKHTKSGRVLIETKPADLSKITIPDPPDLCKALCIIWQVPGAADTPAATPRKHSRPGSNPRNLRAMREPIDNAPDPTHIAAVLPLATTSPMPAPRTPPPRPNGQPADQPTASH